MKKTIETEVNLQTALDHGLSEDEFKEIQKHLGRTPNHLELGIFAAMWSEHCSYKISFFHLILFPN